MEIVISRSAEKAGQQKIKEMQWPPVHVEVLESFEFIYTLVTLQRSLLYLKETAVNL